MSSASVLLHLPEPIGWIALTPDALHEARARACTAMGIGAITSGGPPPRPEGPPLLTPAEAARILAVEASWLLRQAREGRIPHVRLGKYVRFDAAAIVVQCTKAAEAAP